MEVRRGFDHVSPPSVLSDWRSWSGGLQSRNRATIRPGSASTMCGSSNESILSSFGTGKSAITRQVKPSSFDSAMETVYGEPAGGPL